MNIPENVLSTLTEEQKKKIEAVRSPEDLLAIAKEAGYELSGEELEIVSGGGGWSCPTNCKGNTCKMRCNLY